MMDRLLPLLLVLVISLMMRAEGKTLDIPLKDEGVRGARALTEEPLGADGGLAGQWRGAAQESLRAALAREVDTRRARSVIMFLGDGMSVATITAARALRGQRQGRSGEEGRLSFEDFPYTGLSKTYCVDKQVADSACSATAYLCGVKANYGTIGVSAAVKRKDCAAAANDAHHVPSFATWAQDAGMATGFVTTTRVTHASPSGTYGHTSERDWEADHDVINAGENPARCLDLATQLITTEPGMNHRVIMGGGRKNFLPNSSIDEEGLAGVRHDGVDLVALWKADKQRRGAQWSYVTSRDGLVATPETTDYLLGLFDPDHMQYHLDADPSTEPTLAEMTRAAIRLLSKEEKGFFLFVEGGRIDQGHHENHAQKALDETIEFSAAVQAAAELVASDTLLVVTSDHAHTMSYAGYGARGSDILGFGGVGKDGLPYTKLSYANGPSYTPEVGGRRDLSNDDLHNANYTFPSPVPLKDETHGGDDVMVFAQGPWSHLFTGAYEQNVIPHMMAFASCIGPGLTACSKR